jgi:hypothetical protein
MAYTRSAKLPAGLTGSPQPAEPGEWLKSLPTLASFLCDLTFSDGSSRQTGTMLLFTEDGAWKACLIDRADSVTAFVSAKSPGALLAALEKGLERDSLDWRKKRAEPPRKRAGS